MAFTNPPEAKIMGKFRIMPHGRLQEWVAEEHGYFTTEGLDYELVYDFSTETSRGSNGAEPSEVVTTQVG
jgi:NitT/TauT family transport system substrate-binding protein